MVFPVTRPSCFSFPGENSRPHGARLLTSFESRQYMNYHVCCVTGQYLFRIHFFASKRLSEYPAYLHNYIYLLLSSLHNHKCKLFEDLCRSQSRLFTTKYYVTKKSLQCFDQRISRAFPGNLHKSKQFLVV